MKGIHSLIVLFAVAAAFVCGTQVLAPASAGAYQPVCGADEDPIECLNTGAGGGESDNCYGYCDDSSGSSGSSDDCYGHCWDWGDTPGSDGASTSDQGCAYYEECGDPCGYGGECSDDSSDGGFPGGEGPGGSAGGGSVPGQGPPEPCLDYRLAMDAAITRSDYDTYEEQQAIQAYYRCMEDTKQGAGITPRTDPAGPTSSTSAPGNTTVARHTAAKRTNRSRKHRTGRHALAVRGAR